MKSQDARSMSPVFTIQSAAVATRPRPMNAAMNRFLTAL